MNRFILTAFVYSVVQIVSAQISEENRLAILTVLFSDPVEKYVFIDYDERTWNGPYQLKGGRYAFICPDSIFRKVYPNIIDEFPYTIDTDRLLELRTIHQDSLRGVYAKRIVATGILYTVFTRIEINSSRCYIDFYTTSLFDRASYKNHYVQVQSKLCLKKGKWVIENCSVNKIAWKKTL